KSHRRPIEANVQLVSLREVASSLVTARDERDATRLVARYLRGALAFDEVGLLLVDRDRDRLSGTWAWGGGLTPLEPPLGAPLAAFVGSLGGGGGGPARGGGRAPAGGLPRGPPRARRFSQHRSLGCVPLEPAVGLLAAARGPDGGPAPPGERARLEAAAFTLA